MSRKMGRFCSLLVGQPGQLGLKIESSLRMEIEVKKNVDSDADTAVVQIINLVDSSRRRLETIEKQALVIDAGYLNDHGVIFKGALTESPRTARDGKHLITTLKATDFTEDLATRVLSLELKEHTSARSIIQKVADELGLKIGALELKGLKDPKDKTIPLYDGGQRLLTAICRRIGAYWHITDGMLYIAPLGLATRQQVIKLHADSGLIAGVERGGFGIKGKVLLTHNLNPGCALQVVGLDGDKSKADDVVTLDVMHKGRTWEGDWYTHFDSRYRRKVLAA